MTYHSFESMPLVLEVSDIADTLKIGRNVAYTLVKKGEIKSVKIGSHYRIPKDSFIEFLMGGVDIKQE